ncbi:MAG: AAA family ATPase, partial [Clostridia bacterium]|nr:AAA family ATPase [Clostridia bacterium]
MLSRLHIENAAVIEKAELELDAGLNVLTGETGAGKSILIDSINLALGERVSRDIVRTGAQRALVGALFTGVSKGVQVAVTELGFECDDDGALLLQREVTADGRSSSRVNGRPATSSMLRGLGRLLVNTHGQHDNQALLSPECHVSYLDSYAGLGEKLEAYRAQYAGLSHIRSELNALNTDEAEKARRIDLLSYQIDEIEKASLREGEEEELQARRLQIVNAEKISRAVSEAYAALCGGEETSGARGL